MNESGLVTVLLIHMERNQVDTMVPRRRYLGLVPVCVCVCVCLCVYSARARACVCVQACVGMCRYRR
jgi:hypothetical protein